MALYWCPNDPQIYNGRAEQCFDGTQTLSSPLITCNRTVIAWGAGGEVSQMKLFPGHFIRVQECI